jgi:division protein CdvB (Snf7/Vps24/ESCRT-III family)
MTTPSPAQIERKIRQLDNDVQSIYEMLAGIAGTQARHGNRLDEIDSRLGEMDTRLTGRLDGIDGRLDGIDGRLDRIDGRLDTVDAKLDTVITMLGGR